MNRKKLLKRIRERYKIMSEADKENRRLALEDLKFVNIPGYQWDANMRKERGERPCYEFNKLRINGKRVINEIRANRPQGKVRAVEGGDVETSELYEGLIRNIWNTSDGDTVIDAAAEYQVDAGMGAWRIDTQYSHDTAFDQDIIVRSIKNPFCLYADPGAKDVMKRDAEDWILTEKLSNASFEAKYGKAQKVDFEESEFDDQDEWEDDESVRVCEYWYKEPYDKEIWLVQFPDGKTKTVDAESDEGQALAANMQGAEVLRQRTAKCSRIMMVIVSGNAILEGPAEWAGSQFPFVMIYGEYKVIDGKVLWWGLHRFARDAQQSYNISRTAIDETVALAPQAKWWATAGQAAGNTDAWAEAHKKNYPFLLYNDDAKAPGPPQRMGGADVPVALIQQATLAAEDIRDVTGLHETSFGETSNEKSGVAIARKQSQAEIVTYNFPDNMAKGIRRTWEILIDLIPNIYDSERELRVIGADGTEDYKTANELVHDPRSGETIRVNDLSVGRYDVTVTTGPSFSTQRQEAAETYSNLAGQFPEIMGVAGDLIMKSMDLPYAEEIGKRLQTLLPPPIQQQLSEGKDIPPEVQAVMAQAQQAMQQVQQHGQLVQQAAQEVKDEQDKNAKLKSDIVEKLAQLDVAQANFDADVAKQLAALQVKQVQFDSQVSGSQFDLEKIGNASETIKQIDEMAATFMQAAGQLLQEIESRSGIQIAMPNRPRLKSVSAKHVNGQLVAIPEYDGEGEGPRIAKITSQRMPDGSIVGTPEYQDTAPAG